jgi:hypothetical protein
MQWKVEFLDAAVAAELDRLPADIRASFERIVHLIEIAGPQQVHEPYVGDADERPGRHRTSGLCDGRRTPRRGGASLS